MSEQPPRKRKKQDDDFTQDSDIGTHSGGDTVLIEYSSSEGEEVNVVSLSDDSNEEVLPAPEGKNMPALESDVESGSTNHVFHLESDDDDWLYEDEALEVHEPQQELSGAEDGTQHESLSDDEAAVDNEPQEDSSDEDSMEHEWMSDEEAPVVNESREESDEEFNPFVDVSDGEDMNEGVEDVVLDAVEEEGEWSARDIARVPFSGVRRQEWRPADLRSAVRTKESCSMVPHRRRTYLLGLTHGGEILRDIKALDYGAPDVYCPNCGARYWAAELTVGRGPGLDCCQYGRYTTTPNGELREPAPAIVELYTGRSNEAKNFQANILKFNKLFSTAFINGDFQNVGSIQHGLWSLKINGEVRFNNHAYRQAGDDDRPPNHGQIYFLDFSCDTEDEIVMQRLQGLHYNQELLPSVAVKLERYLRENNAFVRALKFTAEVAEEERRKAQGDGRQMEDVFLMINPKLPSERVNSVSKGYVARLMRSGQYNINPCDDFVGQYLQEKFPL